MTMQPARWRTTRRSASRQPGRRGFTLVEMLVSVTLVMLMMMMFAEIFSLAQETMSQQKGMANNDQKARILAQVLRQDLSSRTMRSVYPFKTEMHLSGASATPPSQPVSNFPIPINNGVPSADAAHLLKLRRGYFSFSENNPNNDTDDALQLTINVADPDYGTPGRRLFGKAQLLTGTLGNGKFDQPEFDDGRLNNGAGASPMAEVYYFLRNGNLYRGTLLIRSPYLKGDTRDLGPPGGVKSQGQETPDGFNLTKSNYQYFWNKYDYSAFREFNKGAAHVEFHGVDSLNNDPNHQADHPWGKEEPYGGFMPMLFVPRTLAAPQMRYGFSLTLHGQPVEFLGGTSYSASTASANWTSFSANNTFFGRLNLQERSDPTATYPGTNTFPFQTGVTTGDTDVDGAMQNFEGPRRGIDLMLANVHSFDIKVWDDIIGQFVDLGHQLTGDNPYTDKNGDKNFYNDKAEPGFYNIARLRTKFTGKGTAAQSFHIDSPSSKIPMDYGNRYDTWCPNMWIPSTTPSAAGVFSSGTVFYRNGRAPYRPLKANPDPNTDAFNKNYYDATVQFGDMTLNDDGDATSGEFSLTTGAGNDSDAEAPLRAIKITIRYLDPYSGLTRQVTIVQDLIPAAL